MRSSIVARQPKMRGRPRKTSAPPSTNTTCPVTWVFSSLAGHASSRATTTASDGPCSGIDSQERRGAPRTPAIRHYRRWIYATIA